MIDDKKIEEAANLFRFEVIASMHNPYQCFEEEVDAQSDLIEDSFISGAKWAINEFLNGLWHHADEEPNKGKIILMEMRNGDIYAQYLVNDEYSWEHICTMFTTTRWLYIDDLLPKKGGEE